MAKDLESFGGTATKLSQSPLGIIALFIVLVYAFASLVVVLGKNLTGGATIILVWFMVLFPVLVLAVFAWLVSRHHTKLYAPRDYKKEEHFLQVSGQDLKNLHPVPSQSPASTALAKPLPEEKALLAFRKNVPITMSLLYMNREFLDSSGERQKIDLGTSVGRSIEREAIYEQNRRVFLVHVLTPSKEPGQKYDLFIYLKRHGDKDISDVAKAEFFFGNSWGNRIFTGSRDGSVIGVSTSAYGPFLCTCLVTFDDGYQTSIYRYIDFEMGKVVKNVVVA